MMAISGPMDRSVVFTLLLHHLPGFASMTTKDSEPLITEVTQAWQASDYVDMNKFVKDWIAEHDENPTIALDDVVVDFSFSSGEPMVFIRTSKGTGKREGKAVISVDVSGIEKDTLPALLRTIATTYDEGWTLPLGKET